MKRFYRIILSALCISSLLLTTMGFMIFAQSKTFMIGTRLDGAQLADVNEDLKDNSSSPWACTASPHTMMGTTTAVVTNAVFEGSQGVNFTYTGDTYREDWKTDSAGYSRTHRLFMKNINSSAVLKDGSLLFYIKLPRLEGKTTTAIGLDLRTNTDYLLNGAAKAYVLKKGQSAWEEITADSKNKTSTEAWATSFLKLETGFEGFIRIPTVDAYYANGVGYITKDTQLSLTGIALNIQDMDKDAKLIVGPVIWVNNDTDLDYGSGGVCTNIQIDGAVDGSGDPLLYDLVPAQTEQTHMIGTRLDGTQLVTVNSNLKDNNSSPWACTASPHTMTGTTTAVETGAVFDGSHGVNFTYTGETYGENWKTDALGYSRLHRLFMKNANSSVVLKDGSLLFYIKLPKLKDKTTTAIGVDFRAGNIDYLLNGAAKAYVLQRGQSTWEEIIADSRDMNNTVSWATSFFKLETGFEGFIRIPTPNAYYAYNDGDPYPLEKDTELNLTGVALNIQDMDNGAKLVIGPVIWVNNNANLDYGNDGACTTIQIDDEVDSFGDPMIYDILNDAMKAPAPKPENIKGMSLLSSIWPSLDTENVDLAANNKITFSGINGKANNTATSTKVLADRFIGAQLGTKESYSRDFEKNGYVATEARRFDVNLNQSLTDEITGVVFHLQLPEGNGKNRVWIQAQDATNTQWFNLRGGNPVYIMRKDTTGWVKMWPVRSGDYYVLPLEDGFDGYVNISMDSFNGSITQLSSLNFDFEHLNTDQKIYMGPFYFTTNDLQTKNGAWIDEEVNALNSPIYRNLFTGEEMSLKDITPTALDFPVKGAVERDLPSATFTGFLKQEKVGANDLKVTWPEAKEATSYRVDVYENAAYIKSIGTTGVEYHYVTSKSTSETSASFKELKAGSDYTCIVYAFCDDQLLGIYSSSPSEIPDVGTIVDELPESTVTLTPSYEKIDSNSVKINWPKTDNANSYRVDIYISIMGESDLDYQFVASQQVEGCSAIFKELESGIEYYSVIYALKDTAPIGIYETIFMTITNSSTGEGSGNDITNDNNGDETVDEDFEEFNEYTYDQEDGDYTYLYIDDGYVYEEISNNSNNKSPQNTKVIVKTIRTSKSNKTNIFLWIVVIVLALANVTLIILQIIKRKKERGGNV